MTTNRRKIIFAGILALLMLGAYILYATTNYSNTHPVTDSVDIPSDALVIAKKYFAAREGSVDVTHSTPQAWIDGVKPIITSSLYTSLKQATPDLTNYNIAHSSHFIVEAQLANCRWNIETGSHTSTQGPIVCSLKDITLDQNTKAAIPFESMPAGWSRTGNRVAEVAIVKQNGTWLIDRDMSNDEPLAPPSRHNINFQGTDALLNVGISSSQVDSLEEGFYLFAPNIGGVAIANVGGATRDNSTGDFVRSFIAILDGSTYKASIDYWGAYSLQLTLVNSAGKTVYNSGQIDGSTLQ